MRNQTQSIDELERQAELSRAAFARTVEQLRAEISDTSDAIRSKVSPQAIKSNVKDYVQRTGQHWVDRAKDEFRTNPLRAVALGSLAAYPLLKLARAMPVPLALIGAGILLSGRTPRALHSSNDGLAVDPLGYSPGTTGASMAGGAMSSVERAAADFRQRAGDTVDAAKAWTGQGLDQVRQQAAEGLEAASDATARYGNAASNFARDAASAARQSAEEALRAGRSTAENAAATIRTTAEDTLRTGRDSAEAAAARVKDAASAAIREGRASAEAAADRLSATAATAAERLSAGASAAADRVTATAGAAAHRVSSAGRTGQAFAKDSFNRTPLLVGGLALAAGAIIAAALPPTRTERKLAGDASDALKRGVRDGANEAFRSARDVVGGVAAEVARGAGTAGADMVEDTGEKVMAVAEHAITTAFEMPPEDRTSDNKSESRSETWPKR